MRDCCDWLQSSSPLMCGYSHLAAAVETRPGVPQVALVDLRSGGRDCLRAWDI